MHHCGRLFTAAAVLALVFSTAPAAATEYSTFVEWARAEMGPITPDPAQTSAFGTLLGGNWAAGVPGGGSLVGIAYDHNENGVWLANEFGGGQLPLQSVAAGHAIIRTYNILGYGLTGDGNTDDASVDGNRLLLTDFQGDLNLSDDLIYSVNRTTGALLDHWNVDGVQNPNPNANMDTIIGICTDPSGDFWVSTNNGLIHRVQLLAGGNWTRSVVQAPGSGGSLAGLDYDRCLNQFFATNFSLGRHQYHNTLTAAMLNSFPWVAGAGTQSTITSDNAGVVYTSGFGNNVIYPHEGIACQGTPVEATTWGALKGAYR